MDTLSRWYYKYFKSFKGFKSFKFKGKVTIKVLNLFLENSWNADH